MGNSGHAQVGRCWCPFGDVAMLEEGHTQLRPAQPAHARPGLRFRNVGIQLCLAVLSWP